MTPTLGGSVLPRAMPRPLARPRPRARTVPRAVSAPERLPAAASTSTGGNGNGVSSSGSVALMKMTVLEPLAENSNDAFTFDENAPIVAEAPGGEWSRFRYYGVVAVRG